jgi:putative membrane protein
MKTVIFYSFIAPGLGLIACNGSSSSDYHQDTFDSARPVNKEVKAVQPDTSNFAIAAASGGMMEVELGKIAGDHATNQE